LPWVEVEHEVRRWLRLVALAGATGDSTVDWPVNADEQERAVALLTGIDGGPLVGLHAGAKDPKRRWPPERFAALGDALADRFGARIVLTGAASERPITHAVRSAMRRPVLDLAGVTDLGTFAAVIAQLDLLVTNDTGASHQAAATGTRSVVLFGPSEPEQWAPLDRERHTVLDAPSITGEPDRGRALAALPVAPVLAASAAALDQPFARAIAPTPAVLAAHREGLCAG
jgi:ADP-heptose:LPS heptosyltransferase